MKIRNKLAQFHTYMLTSQFSKNMLQNAGNTSQSKTQQQGARMI